MIFSSSFSLHVMSMSFIYIESWKPELLCHIQYDHILCNYQELMYKMEWNNHGCKELDTLLEVEPHSLH